MSKKNRYKFQQQNSSPAPTPSTSSAYNSEYKIIRMDLVRVAVLNLFFLAVVLAVYFTNKQSGYLEKLFTEYIK